MDDIFPDTSVAEETIRVIREAIQTIYSLSNKNIPIWIEDDFDNGWAASVSIHGTAITNNPYINIVPVKVKSNGIK